MIQVITERQVAKLSALTVKIFLLPNQPPPTHLVIGHSKNFATLVVGERGRIRTARGPKAAKTNGFSIVSQHGLQFRIRVAKDRKNHSKKVSSRRVHPSKMIHL